MMPHLLLHPHLELVHTGSQVLSPKNDTDAYKATFLGGEA